MLTRMVTGFVFSLILMLQSVQDYPTKPVRLIEPFGAGGGPDLVARALGQKLSESWGQPVTVENHPGAGSTAGPALVAKSPADGYTLLVNTSAQAYSAALLKNLPYDPLKDFIPVAPLTSQPYVIVASKLAGIASVRELVGAAKAKPGELKFASTGIGTGSHLGLEEFNLAAVINGNLLAGFAVRCTHDAQEFWLHRRRGDLPDARHRRHHRHLHRGQRRAPPPASLLASRPAHPRLHRVPNLPERWTAALLVVWP